MIFLGTSTAPALAYIDPITGSIVLQALIGGFAAIAVGVRSVRNRILSFFGVKTETCEEVTGGGDTTDADGK